MRRALTISCASMCVLAALSGVVHAAVGCTLNDPDRDIKRLFAGATGYRTQFVTIGERGGAKLAERIEKRLGDRLDPVYEGLGVEYAYYTVLKGEAVIGYVHGVNQKGKYGGMQLILATDPKGVLTGFYYQKISSPEAARFRAKEFTGQFLGLSLVDFDRFKSGTEGERAGSPVSRIKDPSERSAEDFRATLRGIMKNLILLEELVRASAPSGSGQGGSSDDSKGR